MVNRIAAFLLCTFIFLYPVFSRGVSEDLTIFCAASLTEVMEDAAASYTEKTGIRVNINAASSGTLARQLDLGAKGDLFISASEHWMNHHLENCAASASSPFLKNRLVLIAPAASLLKVEIWEEFNLPVVFAGLFSMGDPDHVPAGKYAFEVLEYYGWSGTMTHRILPASNARAALAMVELGECELGLVYASDYMASSKVKLLGVVPEESHTPITYYISLEEGSPAEDLYQFLLYDSEIQALYKQKGFLN
jgi:molybdate transport system substrate-binding protein